MNRFALLAALSIAGALVGCNYSSDHNMHHDMNGMHHDMSSMHHEMDEVDAKAAASAVDLHNTVCPVSGDAVGDSKHIAVYDGKLYHFCCDECPAKFKANPTKYSSAVAADPAKYGIK